MTGVDIVVAAVLQLQWNVVLRVAEVCKKTKEEEEKKGRRSMQRVTGYLGQREWN